MLPYVFQVVSLCEDSFYLTRNTWFHLSLFNGLLAIIFSIVQPTSSASISTTFLAEFFHQYNSSKEILYVHWILQESGNCTLQSRSLCSNEKISNGPYIQSSRFRQHCLPCLFLPLSVNHSPCLNVSIDILFQL